MWIIKSKSFTASVGDNPTVAKAIPINVAKKDFGKVLPDKVVIKIIANIEIAKYSCGPNCRAILARSGETKTSANVLNTVPIKLNTTPSPRAFIANPLFFIGNPSKQVAIEAGVPGIQLK